MPEGAGIRFGQYVLLRRLARGGMAEVFLAQQHLEGFERRVAVKRILPHLADAPDFIKMFLSEAKLAAQLTHPNIVHIYDFGKVESDYFIAMEFVDGVHAGELYKRLEGDRLSPTMIARIGADAASALHYAHELRASNGKPYGLVHRDVSPANLMVTFDGAVKLCDFGIAKAAALGEQLTIPGHVKGKYAYMSPEQTTGSPLDGRSDVYALAIVLWELLAGQTIVARGDAIEAMRAIRDGKLTPIDRVAPWTPPALARAITGALTTNREHRPTAIQFAQELETFIKSSPELGSPLELGSWLRGRFAREPSIDETSQPGGTHAAPGTLAAPATGSNSAPRAAGMSVTTGETTSETRALALSDRMADGDAEAATVIGGEPFVPDDPELAGETDDDDDNYDTNDPDQPENAETVMRSHVYRAQLEAVAAASEARRAAARNTSPAAQTLYDPAANSAGMSAGMNAMTSAPEIPVPPISAPHAQTLYDPRAQSASTAPRATPIAQTLLGPGAMRASPQAGMQPTFPPPHGYAQGPQRPRRALAIGGLVGLAVLSFVIALSTRGARRSQFGVSPIAADAALPDATAPSATPPVQMTTVPPPDALPPPVDAVPPPPADAFVPAVAPPDAPPVTTVLEIRSRPDGAKITIGSESLLSPAQFSLPAGHYIVEAEHDGWLPERRELDLMQNTRVVQDIVFTRRAHPARPTHGKR